MKHCIQIFWPHGKKTCLKIYYERPWWWWKWPIPPEDWNLRDRLGPIDPIPLKLTRPDEILAINDHLSDFIEQGLIQKETVTDMVIMHHINDLVQDLSPAFREKLGSNVKDIQNATIEKAAINFKS